MGSEVSRDRYRGFLIMDPRIDSDSLWSAESTYTQEGPRPGVPVPDNTDTNLVLESSGTQAASSELRIRTQKGGFPGRDKGGFVWRYDGDSLWRGWDVPNAIAAWEAIEWTDGSASPYEHKDADAVTLSDGTVVVATWQRVDPATTNRVAVYIRNASNNNWTGPVTVHTTSGTASFYPCLCVLPDDRILCFHWMADVPSQTRNIRMHVSSDGGASWSVGSRFVLKDPVDATVYDIGRLRAAYLRGDICLVGSLVAVAKASHTDGRVHQWASADLGASFTLVEAFDGTIDWGWQPDICAANNSLHCVYLYRNASGNVYPNLRSITSAYQPLTTIDAVEFGDDVVPTGGTLEGLGAGGTVQYGTAGAFTDGESAVWADEDGMLYWTGRITDSNYNYPCMIWRSSDNGVNWDSPGHSYLATGGAPADTDFGAWWHDTDPARPYPKNIVVTAQGGRAVVIHNWVAATGNEDNSLAAFYLGGYTTVTMPNYQRFKDPTEQACWDTTWVPFEMPHDTAWTLTQVGVPAHSLTGGAYRITTAIGPPAQSNYQSLTMGGTIAEGLICRWTCKINTGGSTGNDEIAVRMSNGDGTTAEDYRIEVRLATTGLALYDLRAGANVGSPVTVDLSSGWAQFLVFLGQGHATLYYRQGDIGDDREWTAGPEGSLTDGGNVAPKNVVFGHIGAATIGNQSDWTELQVSDDEYTGRITDIAQSGGQANPQDLFVRSYSSESLWVTDGTRIRAKDGPSYNGDGWDIDTRYDYPIEAILPSVHPSPLRQWRSTADTVVADIALQLNDQGTADLGNDIIGLYLDGCNWKTGVWQGYDGAAWQTISTIQMHTDRSTLRYTHSNGTIKPGLLVGAEAGQHYIAFNELSGATLEMPGTPTKLRKVDTNTEGIYQTATTGTTKQPTIFFAGLDGTEPASGTDLDIWSPRVLILHHLTGTKYQGYRLRIDSQATVDGYYTVGCCVIGPVVVLGHDYAWGRKLSLEGNTFVHETRAGHRYTQNLGPARRMVDIAWTDPVDLTQISDNAPNADYCLGTTTASAEPIAARHDIPLEGLIEYLQGPHRHVVYLPRIDKGTPDTLTHVSRSRFLYGRITSGWDAEVVIGDEDDNEAIRVPGVTIEEDV